MVSLQKDDYHRPIQFFPNVPFMKDCIEFGPFEIYIFFSRHLKLSDYP